MKYMTRKDEGLGEGQFDSIHWIYEVHLHREDTQEYNYALVFGNEDSPIKIELWREEPDYDTRPDLTWFPEGRGESYV